MANPPLIRLRWRTLIALQVAVGLALAVLAGCFSEHQATAPTEGVCSVSLNQGVPGSTLIVIRGFAFTPAETRVRVGDRVTWINCDADVQHTSTADGGQWSSPFLSAGDAFTQTFETAGDFPYHCTPHPFMTGRVIVE